MQTKQNPGQLDWTMLMAEQADPNETIHFLKSIKNTPRGLETKVYWAGSKIFKHKFVYGVYIETEVLIRGTRHRSLLGVVGSVESELRQHAALTS